MGMYLQSSAFLRGQRAKVRACTRPWQLPREHGSSRSGLPMVYVKWIWGAEKKKSRKISTHLLIMEVDFCPVLCIPKVAVLQAFRDISHFVWYCKAVSDLS